MNTTLKNKTTVISLLILSVVLIATTLFFCQEQDTTFNYEVGKPWLHSRLEADFQFDIELDEATRKHISDSVNQNFSKIYTMDRKRGEQQIALLYKAINGRQGSQQLMQAVSKLYSDGIVDNDAANDIRAGKQLRFLVGNNQLQVVDATNMRTVRQAYAWLTDSLKSNAALQEALRAVDIREYLVPNMKGSARTSGLRYDPPERSSRARPSSREARLSRPRKRWPSSPTRMSCNAAPNSATSMSRLTSWGRFSSSPSSCWHSTLS